MLRTMIHDSLFILDEIRKTNGPSTRNSPTSKYDLGSLFQQWLCLWHKVQVIQTKVQNIILMLPFQLVGSYWMQKRYNRHLFFIPWHCFSHIYFRLEYHTHLPHRVQCNTLKPFCKHYTRNFCTCLWPNCWISSQTSLQSKYRRI